LAPLGAVEANGAVYKHASGRENEAPLRLVDVGLPTIVPCSEETKKRRNDEVAAKMAAVLAEDNGASQVLLVPKQSETEAFDREWGLAVLKVEEAKKAKEAMVQEQKLTAAMKRKSDCDAKQAKIVDASLARIAQYKRARTEVSV